jgi:hypothetical protein
LFAVGRLLPQRRKTAHGAAAEPEGAIMASIDVFFQGEQFKEVRHLNVDLVHTIEAIRAEIIEKHGGHSTILVFLEDVDDPLDPTTAIGEIVKTGPAKLHFHRCRRVEVTVSFGSATAKHSFGPGTTIAHVKRWAAEKQFHMTPADAAEHRLQIAGTHERPPPGTHIGTLASCPACAISFDLVPDKRVQG